MAQTETEKIDLREARRYYYPGEPIQWHLPTTRHDRCPRCGGGLGYLGQTRRACMSDACDTPAGSLVWESKLTPLGFVEAMAARSEPRQRLPRAARPGATGRRTVTCGTCGGTGHNRATCPNTPSGHHRPPYPAELVGLCAGCRAPEDRKLYRMGPPTVFRYRCADCAQGEAAGGGQ